MCSRKSFALLSLLAASLVSPAFGAVNFSITGGAWQLGTGWGDACTTSSCDPNHTELNMDWTIDSALVSQSFSLNAVGDFFDVTFGAAKWIEEDNALTPFASVTGDETDNLGIVGVLKLLLPFDAETGVQNIGVAGAVTGSLADNAVDLTVTFNPVMVDFGTKGRFTVDLSDAVFKEPAWDCSGGQTCVYPDAETVTINARITLVAFDDEPTQPRSSVPEPATLALFGLGLAGMPIVRRRRTSA